MDDNEKQRILKEFNEWKTEHEWEKNWEKFRNPNPPTEEETNRAVQWIIGIVVFFFIILILLFILD